VSAQKQPVVSLEAQDEADRAAIAAAVQIVLKIVAEQHPASLSALRDELARADLGEVDRSLIRTAILRLLNAGGLSLAERPVAAAG